MSGSRPESPPPSSTPEEVRVRCTTFSQRGDGRQGLLRLDVGERTLALKFFGRKRSGLRERLRHFGHWLYQGRSGTRPWERWRTEWRTLELWRREGFGVPEVAVLNDPPSGWGIPVLFLQWVEGPSLCDLVELGPPGPEGARRLRRFAEELGRRHRRALERGEPALLHQHPRLEHVLMDGERFLTIDHELVSVRSGRLEHQVEEELAGWLRSLLVSTESPEAVAVFCEAYPDAERLRQLSRRLEGSFRYRVRGAWRRLRRRPARPSLASALARWRDSTDGEKRTG